MYNKGILQVKVERTELSKTSKHRHSREGMFMSQAGQNNSSLEVRFD